MPTNVVAPLVAVAMLAAPSLHLGRAVASPGAPVRVFGNAGSCPAGDMITILSRAFAGPGFAGIGGVSTRVRPGGSFSAVARVAVGAPPGRYAVTARCGGGNLGIARSLLVTRAPEESIRLRPLNGSRVTGTISYQAFGHGTAVWVRLRGATPSARVRVLLQAGGCARHGASFALAASGKANAAGALVANGQALFHGQPVGIRTVADGGHVFVVVSAGRASACAPIPGMR